MSSPLWFVKIVKKTFPQRFMMARMTRLPLIGRGIEYLLFEGDDMVFLPKDSLVAVNEEVSAEDIVLPSQVIESFHRQSQLPVDHEHLHLPRCQQV